MHDSRDGQMRAGQRAGPRRVRCAYPRPRAAAMVVLAALVLWMAPARCAGAGAPAADGAAEGTLPTVRVGVLRFGTVNWELDTLRHHGFARRRGVAVEVVPLASKSALILALEAGEIDLMVGDWLWVAGRRQQGAPYTFVPYSLAVGSLMVAADGPKQLKQLRGRTIGISGGPGDKSWILLRAYARRTIREDLAAVTDQLFAPSPLLGELITSGELDAVVTNWNYAVRLRARGLRTLIEVSAILPELGIDEPIPLLGWIFDGAWAARHADRLQAFLAASYEAKALLAGSDAEWRRLRPGLGLEPGAALPPLREGYRAGIPRQFGEAERDAVRRALEVIVEEAGAQALRLRSPMLPDGTFWDGFEVRDPLAEP